MIRTATPADRDALYALWAACFNAAHVVPLYETDPGRYGRTFVTEDVSACVYYLPRRIRDGSGGSVLVGGVANVAAHPSVRGRGYVRELLEFAVEAMRADGCAWSLLFTGTPGVYKRWTPFDLQTVSGPLATPSSTSLRSVPVSDPWLREVHERYNATRPLSTVRDDEHWRLRVPLWYTDVLANDAGYAAVRWSDELEVLEVAGDVPAVLSGLATEAAARGVTRGSARLAWDEPGLPYLFEQVTREVDRSAMSRAIHAEPVLGPVFSPADYF